MLACLLVIVIHSPMIRNGQGSFWLSAFNYLASPCIGLFFMISGATLLPIRVSTRSFLRSRFGRIVPPLVTWSILYLGVAVLYAETSPGDALAAALRIPLAAVGNGAFWFLYSLLGLYLFLPFLSPWIAGDYTSGLGSLRSAFPMSTHSSLASPRHWRHRMDCSRTFRAMRDTRLPAFTCASIRPITQPAFLHHVAPYHSLSSRS